MTKLSEHPNNRLGWPTTTTPTTPTKTSAPNKSNNSERVPKPRGAFGGAGQNYGNKFHRAALDGYVDMLCEATKRDANQAARDHHLQLTPTLVAAQCGQLEALRILVGRGGDLDRVTSRGSSALHLAAARNHLNCVSFLVNFGVNMWALDNELHTAKDVAAMEQSSEVLEYLDQMMARQSAISTKQVQKLKDRAKNAAEKRLKQMRKLQLKAIKQVERDERLLAKMSQNRRLLKAAHSMGDIKLVGRSCADLAAPAPAPSVTRALCDNSRSFNSGETRATSQNIVNYIQHTFLHRNAGSTLNSSCPASSISSASGYLSSCSAKSILKTSTKKRDHDAAAAARSPTVLEPTSGLFKRDPKHSRPKYSDLVAVRQDELRKSSQSKVGASSSSWSSVASSSCSGSSSGGSIFASKLRGIGGGVSRKVHLKRLLFANCAPDSAKQAAAAAAKTRGNDAEIGPLRAAGGMKRARSEPDFNATMLEQQKERHGEGKQVENEEEKSAFDELLRDDEATTGNSGEQECEPQKRSLERAGKRRPATTKEPHSNAIYKLETKALPLPPPPPPPPLSSSSTGPAGDQHRQQQKHYQKQQLLLTQCLSQLKLQQQNSFEPANETGRDELPAATRTRHFSHSDELLQHQLNAAELPLRPSIIKQQQQQQQSKLGRHDNEPQRSLGIESAHVKRPSFSAADSIGSVGSFVARNSPELGFGQGPAWRQPDGQVPSGRTTDGAVSCNSSAKFSRHSPTSQSHSAASSTSDPIQSDALSSCSNSSGPESGHQNNQSNEEPQSKLLDHKLDQFLSRNNLGDLIETLARERIDFEALLLLNEDDLRSLGLLLGPRRKLLNAVERHKKADQGAPSALQDACMVDTQF